MNKRSLIAGVGRRKADVSSIAMDLSLDYIKENIKKNNYMEKEVMFVVGDVRNMPFKNKIFDKIISIEVLEHIKEKEDIMYEFSRVSKNDADLHLQTSTRYCDRLLGRLSKRYYDINTSNHHQYCIEAEEVKKLIKSNKYIIREELYLFSPRWFLICAFMDLLKLDLDSSGTLTGSFAKHLQYIGYKLDKHSFPIFEYVNKKLKGRLNKYAKSILLEARKI